MVGSFVGIFTGNLVDQQEDSMKRQFVKAALKMNNMMKQSSKALKQFQKNKVLPFFGY
jgi:hypothetical protein